MCYMLSCALQLRISDVVDRSAAASPLVLMGCFRNCMAMSGGDDGLMQPFHRVNVLHVRFNEAPAGLDIRGRKVLRLVHPLVGLFDLAVQGGSQPFLQFCG